VLPASSQVVEAESSLYTVLFFSFAPYAYCYNKSNRFESCVLAMEHKLKDIFRKHKSRDKGSSTHVEVNNTSRHRPSVDNPSAVSTSRSAHTGAHARHSVQSSADSSGPPSLYENAVSDQKNPDDSIANDYLAYQPALENDDLSRDVQRMTLGGGTPLVTDASLGKHSEDVADRNMGRSHSRKVSVGAVGGDRQSWPARTAQDEPHLDRKRTRHRNSLSLVDGQTEPGGPGSMLSKPTIRAVTDSSNDAPPKATRKHASGVHPDLKNVVDLNDSVDTDKVITYAPGMTIRRTVPIH
jgi:hypothetical protein